MPRSCRRSVDSARAWPRTPAARRSRVAPGAVGGTSTRWGLPRSPGKSAVAETRRGHFAAAAAGHHVMFQLIACECTRHEASAKAIGVDRVPCFDFPAPMAGLQKPRAAPRLSSAGSPAESAGDICQKLLPVVVAAALRACPSVTACGVGRLPAAPRGGRAAPRLRGWSARAPDRDAGRRRPAPRPPPPSHARPSVTTCSTSCRSSAPSTSSSAGLWRRRRRRPPSSPRSSRSAASRVSSGSSGW